MEKSKSKFWRLFLLLLSALIFTACGGGGDSSSPPGTPVNVAGTWSTTERVNATACGEGTYTEYLTYTVTQSGSNITVRPQGTTCNLVVP